MTLSDFFADYYRPLRLRGRSANTTRLYANTIRQYGLFLGRDATIEDLSDLSVSRYLEHRGSCRSPYTAEKERNQLCAIWRCASDRRIVADRPCVPQSPLPSRIPEAWSIDELRQLLSFASVAAGMIGDVPARVYWPAIILCLWQSAERIGAILAVTKSDYSRPRIMVRAEYRKGGKRDKLYTFTNSACDLFDVLARSSNGPLLFEWPKNRLYLWQCFGRLLDDAGLGGHLRRKFHQLRRSAATHYCAGGGDPVALLDHSSPRVTRAYLDIRYTDTGPRPCDVLPTID